jgi:hypothetical protein
VVVGVVVFLLMVLVAVVAQVDIENLHLKTLLSVLHLQSP